MKKKNWLWIVIAAVVVVAGVFFVPRLMNPGQAKSAGDVGRVVTVKRAEVVESSGEFQVHPYADMSWATSGTVGEILVKAGDHVKADQVLMTLKTSSVSSSILSAKAQLITNQKALDDLLHSNTDQANAWITLRDAETALQDAQNYRDSLNDEIKGQRIKMANMTLPNGNTKQVPMIVKYKYNADPEAIADADASLALRKAQYDDAQRAYNRIKDGVNSDDLAKAQANVDSSQAIVNTMNITAPFDGEVLYVSASVGDVVNTGSSALTIADTNHYYVEAQIDEADIAKVKVGQTAEITNDGMPGVTFTGTVTAIDPMGVNKSGLIKFITRIALNKSQAAIFPGSTANVKITVSDVTARLVVPLAAIQNGDNGEYVTVVDSAGQKQNVTVASGELMDEGVIVTGDLKEGDSVVLASSSSSIPMPSGR